MLVADITRHWNVSMSVSPILCISYYRNKIILILILNAAQTVKETRQLHRFQPIGKLLVYNTSLQASPPIVKSISLSRVQIEDNTLQISSFVACTYDEKWWLEMVAQTSFEFGDHNSNFMHPSGPGKQFHWPTKFDTCWSSNIVCVIEAPILSSSSSRKYIISENDYKKNN